MKRFGVVAAALLCVCFLAAQDAGVDAVEGPTIGGDVGPHGRENALDLPRELRLQNTGGLGRGGPGTGAGLCVFTSIEHAARWQNEPRLIGFQSKMTHERGGGWPEKVDEMIRKYGSGTRYVQHTGGEIEFLFRAIQSGRMPSVTYCGDDPFYGSGVVIAHMVNVTHIDPPNVAPRLAAVLDNNHPSELVWMTVAEFSARWRGKRLDGSDYLARDQVGRAVPIGGGWAVVLLAPAPSPVPSN